MSTKKNTSHQKKEAQLTHVRRRSFDNDVWKSIETLRTADVIQKAAADNIREGNLRGKFLFFLFLIFLLFLFLPLFFPSYLSLTHTHTLFLSIYLSYNSIRYKT